MEDVCENTVPAVDVPNIVNILSDPNELVDVKFSQRWLELESG